MSASIFMISVDGGVILLRGEVFYYFGGGLAYVMISHDVFH